VIRSRFPVPAARRDILEPQSPAGRRVGSSRRWLAVGLASLVVLGGGTMLAWAHDRLHVTLSPYDEGQHIDYVDRMLDFEMLRQGDLLGQEALHAWACRGAPGLVEPPCDPNPVDPRRYAWGGVNTAHIHPPTYYFLTSLPARLYLLAGAEVTAAGRLVGGLWLGGSLLLLWVALGTVGVGNVQRVIVLALVGTSPVVLHSSLTVNPDGTGLLAGSLMILATVGWERRRIPTGGLALAAALVVALKLTNVLAVVASLLYLVLRSRAPVEARPEDAEEPRPRHAVAAVGLTIGAAASAATWLVVHALLARNNTDPQEVLFQVDSLQVGKVLSQLWALVTPIDVQYVPPFLDSPMVLAVSTLIQLVLVGSVIAIALHVRRIGRAEAFGLGGAVVMLAGGIMLVLGNYVLNSQIFVPIPARYGLSLVPFLAAAVGVILRGKLLLWSGSALAASSVLLIAGQFIAGATG
jgi:hypothetical protein